MIKIDPVNNKIINYLKGDYIFVNGGKINFIIEAISVYILESPSKSKILESFDYTSQFNFGNVDLYTEIDIENMNCDYFPLWKERKESILNYLNKNNSIQDEVNNALSYYFKRVMYDDYIFEKYFNKCKFISKINKLS